jgi:hypothetical protein
LTLKKEQKMKISIGSSDAADSPLVLNTDAL